LDKDGRALPSLSASLLRYLSPRESCGEASPPQRYSRVKKPAARSAHFI